MRNEPSIENEILWQLGSIKTSIDSFTGRFEKLETQLIKEHDGFKEEIKSLDTRLSSLEKLRSNVYAVAAAIGLAVSAMGSLIIAKLQHWMG